MIALQLIQLFITNKLFIMFIIATRGNEIYNKQTDFESMNYMDNTKLNSIQLPRTWHPPSTKGQLYSVSAKIGKIYMGSIKRMKDK